MSELRIPPFPSLQWSILDYSKGTHNLIVKDYIGYTDCSLQKNHEFSSVIQVVPARSQRFYLTIFASDFKKFNLLYSKPSTSKSTASLYFTSNSRLKKLDNLQLSELPVWVLEISKPVSRPWTFQRAEAWGGSQPCVLLLLDVKMAVQQKILRRNRSSSGNGGLSSYKRWSLQFPPTSCHGGSWQPEELLASGKSSEMNSFTSSASSFSQFDRSDVLKAVFPEAAARNATAIAGDAGPASLANAISRSSGHLVRNSILFGLF